MLPQTHKGSQVVLHLAVTPTWGDWVGTKGIMTSYFEGPHHWLAWYCNVGSSKYYTCSEGFYPGSPVFLPPQKPTIQFDQDRRTA